MDKVWDVFISHASEDKESVARPLADTLSRAGVRVWLDEQELRLGDSLSGKIDEGLAKSHFGIVILSPHFFEKHWPQQELAGLRAKQEGGRKVILPVWHNVEKATLTEFSPILADAKAANTADGLDKVAKSIAEVIFGPGSDSPSAVNPQISRRLIELLDNEPDRKNLLEFLRFHKKILSSIFNTTYPVLFDTVVLDHKFDMVVLSDLDIFRKHVVHFIDFLPIWGNPLETPRRQLGLAANELRLARILETHIDSFKKYIVRQNAEYSPSQLAFSLSPKDNFLIFDISAFHDSSQNSHKFSYMSPYPVYTNFCCSPCDQVLQYNNFVNYDYTIYAGRRSFVGVSRETAEYWHGITRQEKNINVRTYDSMIEKFLKVGL